MNRHLTDKKTVGDLIDSISKYHSYGFTIDYLLECFEISRARYFNLKKRFSTDSFNYARVRSYRKPSHAITEEEVHTIVKYAVKNTKYFHRELAYRMIDEDVAYVSVSTCYRVLKKHGLIKNYTKRARYSWEHKYSNSAGKPDELWQTDITYIRYRGHDYYLLIFIDVYSRFVVFSAILTSMSSQTVTLVFTEYVEKNLHLLQRKPRLQSDNGSCYIGYEFKALMSKYNFEHSMISPGCPTENIIVERFNRTVKELLYEEAEPRNFQHLADLIDKVCHYYNYDRYHKSLGYVTPYTFYRGDPEQIFQQRKGKLELAKERRRLVNLRN